MSKGNRYWRRKRTGDPLGTFWFNLVALAVDWIVVMSVMLMYRFAPQRVTESWLAYVSAFEFLMLGGFFWFGTFILLLTSPKVKANLKDSPMKAAVWIVAGVYPLAIACRAMLLEMK